MDHVGEVVARLDLGQAGDAEDLEIRHERQAGSDARKSTSASLTGPGLVRFAAWAPPTLTTGPEPDEPGGERLGALHRDRRVFGAVHDDRRGT